jgi:glycosyltransferase involved in cell wall biosynthesis
MDVSVVVCTYNRCAMLRSALESILAQDTQGVACEVIVVDNNSADETRDVVGSFLDGGRRDVRYIFEGRQGLSHARNAGIAAARAPVVAFTDDDVHVAGDWVATIKRRFDANPDIDVLGGKVLPEWPRQPPAWLTERHWAPLALMDHGDEPFVVDATRPVCLVGANLSVRRSLFDVVGGFEPGLQRVKDGIGSLEDHEFEMRVWAKGRRGLYDPGVVVSAAVQDERLTKAYHRRWHHGHGRFYALLRDEQIEQGRARLFDVPGHVYRHGLANTAGWLMEWLRGRQARAFRHECEVRFVQGFVHERRRAFAAAGPAGTLRELTRFALMLGAAKLRGRKRPSRNLA